MTLLSLLVIAGGLAVSPVDLARQFAERSGAEFGPARVDGLSQGAHVVRLAQQARGLPVIGGEVVTRVEADGRITYSASALKTVGEFDPNPKLTLFQAAQSADSQAPRPVRDGAAEQAVGRLALLVEGGATRLVYELALPPLLPIDLTTFLVDAHSGAVLRTMLQARNVTDARTARVFASGTAAQQSRLPSGAFGVDGTSKVLLDVDAPGPLAARSTPVEGWNCCAWGNCDETGKTPLASYSGHVGSISISEALCEPKQIANNTVNPGGDFEYTPPAEPAADTPVPTPGIDSQPFAEVNVFHHARQMVAWFSALDPSFHLSSKANPLRTMANYLLPDDAHGTFDKVSSTYKVTTLMRADNSSFVPALDFGTIDANALPAWLAYDSLWLFEGATANFGYDASVIDHEFTHAVVHAYPDLGQDVLFDTYGTLDAPGAMNEAFADYFSGAARNDPHIGDYVSHHMAELGANEGALRDLTGTLKCPNDLDGEVHDDSRFFSEALWEGRTQLGTDEAARKRYDTAIFDALKLLTSEPTFEDGGKAVLASIASAFGAAGKTTLAGIFAARGVTGCLRVVTPPVKQLYLPALGSSDALASYAPGAVQLAITLPPATATTTLSATLSDGGGPGTSPALKILVHAGGPVAFEQASNGFAPISATEFAATGSAVTVVLNTPTLCEAQTYYVVISNATTGGHGGGGLPVMLTDVATAFTTDSAQLTKCQPPSPPPPNSGSGGDAPRPHGCGCAGSGLDAGLAALLAAVFIRFGACQRRSRPL